MGWADVYSLATCQKFLTYKTEELWQKQALTNPFTLSTGRTTTVNKSFRIYQLVDFNAWFKRCEKLFWQHSCQMKRLKLWFRYLIINYQKRSSNLPVIVCLFLSVWSVYWGFFCTPVIQSVLSFHSMYVLKMFMVSAMVALHGHAFLCQRKLNY